MERLQVTANGIDFECLRWGDGDELALCLHGFPDDAGTFAPLAERLAAAGYTVVAPYMRGYAPTDPAPDGDYTAGALGADAAALARALPGERAICVGHDWGAVAAYTAARAEPAAFDRIVGMAVPPNFAARVADHPAQLARSWYIWFFQLEGLAEYAIRRADFALLEYLWSTWSPGWDWPAARFDAVRETFRTGGTLSAALAYYRQLLDGARADGGGGTAVPGLVLAGAADGCIGPALFEGTADALGPGSRTAVLSDAGHFMHRERPAAVAEHVLTVHEL